jgi:arabinogalactan oligomer/maltooligosaccharide transport system permease protein
MSTLTAPTKSAPPVPKKKRHTFRWWLRNNSWRHAIAWLVLFFAIVPILWVISAAFTKNATFSAGSLIPTSPTLQNFRMLFNPQKYDIQFAGSTFFLRWYVNTMFIAIVAGFFSVLLGTIAAYAFSRYRFKGRNAGMLFLLVIQMFPTFLALVAIYIIFQEISLVYPAIGLGTLWALILIYMGGALGANTWLLKGFFDTIPIELDESARVDGGSHGQIFWLVVMPLAAPILAVVFLLSFIGTINEFVIASIILVDPKSYTLALGLRGYISGNYSNHWGPFAAGAILASIPAVILFYVLQRYIVQGLTAGSVKG